LCEKNIAKQLNLLKCLKGNDNNRFFAPHCSPVLLKKGESDPWSASCKLQRELLIYLIEFFLASLSRVHFIVANIHERKLFRQFNTHRV
jgi:hypothetical protein